MRPNVLPDHVASSITKDILNGLLLIHEKNIIHRDLKPENILIHFEKSIGKDGKSKEVEIIAKVSDFGFSKFVDNSQRMNSSVGTLYYNAPEVVKKENYDLKKIIFLKINDNIIFHLKLIQ